MFVKLLFFLVVHALNLQRSDLEYFSLAISIPDKQFRNTRLPTLIAKGHNYDVQLSVTFFLLLLFLRYPFSYPANEALVLVLFFSFQCLWKLLIIWKRKPFDGYLRID